MNWMPNSQKLSTVCARPSSDISRFAFARIGSGRQVSCITIRTESTEPTREKETYLWWVNEILRHGFNWILSELRAPHWRCVGVKSCRKPCGNRSPIQMSAPEYPRQYAPVGLTGMRLCIVYYSFKQQSFECTYLLLWFRTFKIYAATFMNERDSVAYKRHTP